jgi:hypothetical protein
MEEASNESTTAKKQTRYNFWTEMFTAASSADIQHLNRGIAKQVRQVSSHKFWTNEAYVNAARLTLHP